MTPIRTGRKGWPRIGSLSAGHQTVSKKGKVHPTKTDTIVVHALRREILEPFVACYGGEIAESPTSTEERERFYLVTDAREMDVLIPGDLERSLSQYYEAWASSGLVRRCDGLECLLWRKEPKKGEVVGELSEEIRPCICDTEEGEDRLCKPTIRLSVVPVDVAPDIPDIGVFQLRSTGYFTNAELEADLELIQAIIGRLGAGVPLKLIIEQVRSRRGLMPKFRLTLGATPREIAANLPAAAERPLLPSVEVSPEDEEPVGGFIDKPTEKPLKDASEGKQESESAVAAIPSAPAPSESPDDPVPAPDVVELHGITVRYIGGEPAKDERERCTASQWVVINRAGQKAELGPEMVQDIFLQRHGFKGSDAKKETAQEFHNFLIEETKRLVKAAQS